MAITNVVLVRAQELWPQRDARDPLGIWVRRFAVVGDASGGSITTQFSAPANRRASFVFACYSVTALQNSGTAAATTVQVRLLTNWPDADPEPGVSGFSTAINNVTLTDADLTGQISVPSRNLIGPNDRFILLHDPRQNPNLGTLVIVEVQWGINVLNNIYSFEVMGYYWDRAVMTTPGGPRHPGSD